MNEKAVYMGKRLLLMVGLLSVGAGLGFHLSLSMMQEAAIAQGALPVPGLELETNWMQKPLYQTAVDMKELANGSAAIGAVFLLAYGGFDRYKEVLVE